MAAISRTRLSTSASATPPVAQRKGQVVVDRHGVVDDRKLEHLGDVAALGSGVGDVLAVEQDAALGRSEKPGYQIEQGGLAAARGPEQRVGAAVGPVDRQLLEGIILVAPGSAR